MATVAEILISRKEDMTRAERQLSDIIMDNYPISGLGSTTDRGTAGAKAWICGVSHLSGRIAV